MKFTQYKRDLGIQFSCEVSKAVELYDHPEAGFMITFSISVNTPAGTIHNYKEIESWFPVTRSKLGKAVRDHIKNYILHGFNKEQYIQILKKLEQPYSDGGDTYLTAIRQYDGGSNET